MSDPLFSGVTISVSDLRLGWAKHIHVFIVIGMNLFQRLNLMSDKGIFKHIRESSLLKLDTRDLQDFLAPVKKFKQDEKLWRVLPSGDWVRIR